MNSKQKTEQPKAKNQKDIKTRESQNKGSKKPKQ